MSLETYELGDEKGFTLIEVLITLVIVTLCFAAIMFSVNNASRNFVHMRDKTSATWVASNVIAQAQTNQLHGVVTGVESMLGKDWVWQLSIKTTLNPAVNELHVTVDEKKSAKRITHLIGYMGLR